MVAGADCPECGSRVESTGGNDFVCSECGHEFDSTDLFLP